MLLSCAFAAGARYGELRLAFEEAATPGTFTARASGLMILVSRDEAVLAVAGSPAVRMRVSGGKSPGPALAQEPLPSRANYLIGKDSRNWRTGVPLFGSARVQDVLPHTDIIYYGNHKRFEYDLVLHPGADPGKIRLHFDGQTGKPEIDAEGNLILRTAAGDIVEHRPEIEQTGHPVEAHFRLESNGDVSILLGPYDRTQDLRIDPAITYITYLGGTSDDMANAIAVDSAGNAYIAGATSSFTFPITTGSLQTVFPSTSSTVAFVTKLNPTGTGLVYTTFLGGSGLDGGDVANAIAVDGGGNVYVAGSTGSSNFPVTAGALSTSLTGTADAFVAKINPSGSALVYSTYLGGNGQESASGIAVDTSGNAYITGATGSANFPVSSTAPQKVLKSANDAFVTKLNPAGNAVVYSSYLGGSAEDHANGIAIDSSGDAYVTGTTASTDFPVTSMAFQRSIGPAPVAFAAQMNSAGTAFTYATYLGGTGGDSGNAVAVDGSGNAYVAGTTESADFPVTAGVLTANSPGTPAYGHAFLTKLNPSASALVYSTYLGGNSGDGANGVAVDSSGDAVVVGFTYSTNFPISASPADPVANYGPAAFISEINPGGTGFIYSTLLGASGATVAQSVSLDAGNHAYVAGYTSSQTLPTSPGAFQATDANLSSKASTGFAAKIDFGSATVCTLSFSPAGITLPVAGGSAMVSVTAPAGCAWEAIPAANWIAVTAPTSGVGPGVAVVKAGSNAMSLSSRTTTVNAGSAALSVTQSAGSCSAPQFDPATQTFSSMGGPGSVAVALPAGCPVTATSAVSWITVNSGAAATGDDLVTFTVASLNGAARTGTLTIAGVSYSITQASSYCVTSLTPSSTSLPATGGSVSVSLAAPAGCAWTAASSASWLTVSPTSGTGSATINLTAAANSTAAQLTSSVAAGAVSFTITENAAQPTAVSVTPASASGVSQVFTAVYSDAAGASVLSNRFLIVNSTLSVSGGCWVWINSNGIYLENDTATILLGPLTGSNSFSNSQCTLNSASIANSGTTSTVTVSLSFKPGFAGTKNLYMSASDTLGNSSAWQNLGTFTVVPSIPAPVSVTPTSGSGTSQTFTAVYSDAAGASLLNYRFLIINSALSISGGCWLWVDTTGIYLENDTASALLGPLSGSNSYSNSQCTLNSGSVSNSGTTSTVTVSITFKATFAGTKNLFMLATDTAGNSSTWQSLGTFAVTAPAPTPVSVTPSSGSGTTQTFTAVYSDAGGASLLNYRFLIINSTLSITGACWVWVDTNGIYLENDDASVLLGPLSGSNSYSNSQCTLNSGSVSNSGTTSTVTVSITFKSSFAGTKNLYMSATDALGNSSVRQSFGSYTVVPSVPAPVSVTPSSGSGASQVFTAVYSDAAGASLLNYRFLIINSTLSISGGCWVWVDTTGIYLESDNASALLGPLTASNSFSNSQCTLNSGSVSNSGTTSTVTVSITFKSSFAGIKNLFMAASDISGNTSLWQNLGAFTATVVPSVPMPVSVSPSSGSGTSQVFTAVYSDAAGASMLNYRFLIINSTLSISGGCWVWVDTTGIYLENDNATALLGPLTGSNSFSNSQCTLNSGTVSNTGTTSTVTVSLSFKPAFAGTKNVYLSASDTVGNNSVWQLLGTFASR